MLDKKLGGIYAIVCTATWRSYVGSSVDLLERKSEHFRQLLGNKHNNYELQSDFNKFGKEKFYWEIVEIVDDHLKLIEREYFWMTQGHNLYNKVTHSDCFELTEKEYKRFWSWVDIKDKDECWNWFGAKDKDGYGRIGFRRNKKKKMFRSNRLALFLSKKSEWNKHLVVCHNCDNPSCCNPNHLFLGSLSDNAKDRLSKRRGNNKLNYEIVNELREKYINNELKNAKEFIDWLIVNKNTRVSANAINKILSNKTFYDKNYNITSRLADRNLFSKDYQPMKA